MPLNIKDRALPETIIRSVSVTADSETTIESINDSQKKLRQQANAEQTLGKDWNPFSIAARIQRKGQEEVLNAKLAMLRDDLWSIVRSNRLFDDAAENAVKKAAETFIAQVNADVFNRMVEITNDAKTKLMKILSKHLRAIQEMEGELPDALLGKMIDNAIASFWQKLVELENLPTVYVSAPATH